MAIDLWRHEHRVDAGSCRCYDSARRRSNRDYTGADAFIALPGGWGTLEEITEVITLKQLGQHNKPIVFLNTAGYYKLFFEFIEHSRKAKFISSAYDHLYYIADAVEPALDYIQKYQPIPQVKKY